MKMGFCSSHHTLLVNEYAYGLITVNTYGILDVTYIIHDWSCNTSA